MKKSLVRPTLEEIQQEINRRRALQSHLRFLRSALYALVVISAVTILIFTLWLPVFRITGSSMQPTLMADEMVLSVKTDHVQIGDIIAFFHELVCSATLRSTQILNISAHRKWGKSVAVVTN